MPGVHAPQRPPCLTAGSACSGTCAPALPCSPSGVRVPPAGGGQRGCPNSGIRAGHSLPSAAPLISKPPCQRRHPPLLSEGGCHPQRLVAQWGAGRRAVDRLNPVTLNPGFPRALRPAPLVPVGPQRAGILAHCTLAGAQQGLPDLRASGRKHETVAPFPSQGRPTGRRNPLGAWPSRHPLPRALGGRQGAPGLRAPSLLEQEVSWVSQTSPALVAQPRGAAGVPAWGWVRASSCEVGGEERVLCTWGTARAVGLGEDRARACGCALAGGALRGAVGRRLSVPTLGGPPCSHAVAPGIFHTGGGRHLWRVKASAGHREGGVPGWTTEKNRR